MRASAIILAAACVLQLAAARPTVLVRKTLTGLDAKPGQFDGYIVAQQNFTVTYDVINAGDETAYDVKVSDDWPSQSFDVVEGSSTASWSTITAGSSETLKVVLRAKTAGVMNTGRAEVEYKIRLEAEEGEEEEFLDVTSSSSTPGRVEIMTAERWQFVGSSHDVQVSLAVLLAIASVVLPFMSWRDARRANDRAAKSK